MHAAMMSCADKAAECDHNYQGRSLSAGWMSGGNRMRCQVANAREECASISPGRPWALTLVAPAAHGCPRAHCCLTQLSPAASRSATALRKSPPALSRQMTTRLAIPTTGVSTTQYVSSTRHRPSERRWLGGRCVGAMPTSSWRHLLALHKLRGHVARGAEQPRRHLLAMAHARQPKVAHLGAKATAVRLAGLQHHIAPCQRATPKIHTCAGVST